VREELIDDPDKRDPRDFALWKKDPDHLMQWHSPWGWGFPGWHIECSVMSAEYLGEHIDLHAGGEDLIFPHHECEIAQAESLTDDGEPFARTWVHTRFLQVEGEKMSKSKGNFFTVRDLIEPESDGGRGIDPLALRYTLLSGQYRKPFNFTKKTLKDSARMIRRYQDAAALVDDALEQNADGNDHLGDRLAGIYDRTLDAMCDDLNTPQALAVAHEGVKLLHGMKGDLNAASAQSAQRWLEQTNALLGIVWSEYDGANAPADDSTDDPFAEKVDALIEERTQAREDGNYDRADAIRDELDAMGIEVMDSSDGTTWREKIDV
jgi:cysteinyl-tRNA synthetase